MQDEPTPEELIKAVADFLRHHIAPGITGHAAFKLRIAINALDLVTRQLALASPGDAAEAARLSQLLGRQGTLGELNGLLAEAIASGEMDLQTPGLAEHLWQTTMDKLAVDQPNYGVLSAGVGADRAIGMLSASLRSPCDEAIHLASCYGAAMDCFASSGRAFARPDGSQ
jgi:hypothetical protein